MGVSACDGYFRVRGTIDAQNKALPANCSVELKVKGSPNALTCCDRTISPPKIDTSFTVATSRRSYKFILACDGFQPVERDFKYGSDVSPTRSLELGAVTLVPSKVWFWFTDCGTEALVLDLTLDGKALYRSTIPVCAANREDHTESKKVSFSFVPSRAITWSGYRDEAPTTEAGQTLSADLWQAGADPNDLVVGISVSEGRVIYTNATHVAYLERPNTTEIEKGLLITTHPTDTAGWVHVPGGMLIRPECVHHIPNGATVSTESGDVTLNGTVIAHWDDCAEPGISTRPLPP